MNVVTFPDAELLVIDFLRDWIPTATIVSRIPSPRPAELILVHRLPGGGRSNIVLETVRLEIAAHAADDVAADDLARDARSVLSGIVGTHPSTTVYRIDDVDDVDTPDPVSGESRSVFSIDLTIRCHTDNLAAS